MSLAQFEDCLVSALGCFDGNSTASKASCDMASERWGCVGSGFSKPVVILASPRPAPPPSQATRTQLGRFVGCFEGGHVDEVGSL